MQTAEGAERPNALRQLAAAMSELLKRELDAAAALVAAADGPRGRRTLSMLGEAGERLAATASKALRAEHESAASLL